VVRPYAWGTRTAIAELQGRPVPAPGSEAELWMGAHPSAPSGVHRSQTLPSLTLPASSAPPISSMPSVSPVTLDAVIAADPDRELGPECAARFGGRLPFLLKVLSAEQALSIQVHPSRAQAKAGFAAENALGLAPGDPARNYVDDWPKPELLYALTPFEVVAGLRTPADAAALLRALAVDELGSLAAGLGSLAAGPTDLGAAFASVLEWPEPGPLVASVVAACARLADAGGPYADACAAAVRVAAHHPGDLGVIALLLIRHVVLQPGQAVFMPAGGLHAYLRGTGIELLANSDNVVRAGLTPKHIDVPELLKLVDPSVSVPVLAPQMAPDGIAWFDTPAPEFRLYVLDLTGPALALPGTGPRILLCLDGACTLRPASRGPLDPTRPVSGSGASGSEASCSTLDLTRGDSCFIPFADGPVHATGHARLVLATPGPPPP
jgi:mannose-6-phosphate isomerase